MNNVSPLGGFKQTGIYYLNEAEGVFMPANITYGKEERTTAPALEVEARYEQMIASAKEKDQLKKESDQNSKEAMNQKGKSDAAKVLKRKGLEANKTEAVLNLRALYEGCNNPKDLLNDKKGKELIEEITALNVLLNIYNGNKI
jgi:hypothetical protein